MSTIQYRKQNQPELPSVNEVKQWVGEDGVLRYIDENGVIVDVVKGDTGDQGPQGEIGPQGPQGETGPQGPQGAVSVLYSQDSATTIAIPGNETYQFLRGFQITTLSTLDLLLTAVIFFKPASTGDDIRLKWVLNDGVSDTDIGPELSEEMKDDAAEESAPRGFQINIPSLAAGTYEFNLYGAYEGAKSGGVIKYTSFTLWSI